MLTLETAKKLKEVGWSKETEWIWYNINPTKNQWVKILYDMLEDYVNEFIWSPSLEELLAEMPREILLEKPNPRYLPLVLDRKTVEWRCGYTGYTEHYLTKENIETFIFLGRHPDPTEAVAQLYIKLRQEGLIK